MTTWIQIGLLVLLIIVGLLVLGWLIILIVGGEADNDKKKWM